MQTVKGGAGDDTFTVKGLAPPQCWKAARATTP